MSTMRGVVQSYEGIKKWYENLCLSVDAFKDVNEIEYRKTLNNLNSLYEILTDMQHTLENCNITVELPSFPDFLTQ